MGCDHNTSGQQKKCSDKEGGSSSPTRCKHGHRKSNGSTGANRRPSKRNSKEEPENNISFNESQDIQKIGSFRKDSGSTKELNGERGFGSSETTLKTGCEINIVEVPNAEADNIQVERCDGQSMDQKRPSTSQRRDSTQSNNFNQNQEGNTEPPIEKCPPPENSGRRSSTEKKRCSFKLPGSVCSLSDECDEDAQEKKNCPTKDTCEEEIELLKQEAINAARNSEECDDDKWDYDLNGKRGTYKKIKVRKNPTTVTNLREKIQQYVRNRPDQVKPAPDKLTPFSEPIFTQCFEPVDEELERQLKAEKEAARKLMEERKLETEMQCYKKVIPYTLPCKTQLDYLECLGASAAARVKYMEYAQVMKDAEAFRKRMAPDWNCQQQMNYLNCMGVREEVKQVLACSDQPPCDPQQGSFNNQSMQQNAYNPSFSAMGNQQNNPPSFSYNNSFSAMGNQGNKPPSFSYNPPMNAMSNQQNQPPSFSYNPVNAMGNQGNKPPSFSNNPSYSAMGNQENKPPSFSAIGNQENKPPSYYSPSFTGASFSAPPGGQDEIGDMIAQCKSEFRSSGLSRPCSSCKTSESERLKEEARRKSWKACPAYDAGSDGTSGSGVGDERRSSDGIRGSVVGNERRSSNGMWGSGVGDERRSSNGMRGSGVAAGRKSSDVKAKPDNSSNREGATTKEQMKASGGGSKSMASFRPTEDSFLQEDEEDPSDTESDLNNPMFGQQAEAPEPTLAEQMKLYKTHLANIRRRYFGALCKEMENTEMITPDIAAAMVYSGELGMSMKAAPEKIYDFLYPDAPGNQVINIAEVMGNLPRGLDDIVVPIVPPITLESRDYPDMEDPAMLDSPRVIQVGPALNLIDEPEVKGLLDPVDIKELVTGHTSANYLELMFPEVADMQVTDGGEGEEEEDEEAAERALERARQEMFNIKLMETMPQHFSQVQMRGTIPPNWFPGYWSASPSREGVFKSSKPSEVMEYIWEEMQPERVRPAGAAYIIGN